MKKNIEINDYQSRVWGLLLLISIYFLCSLTQAEVTLDGSVGPAGALNGPDYQVTENLGKRAGSNLFHSFGRFNLNASESATFSGSSGIKNVISRVTGGQTSNIDGTLRVSIPNANLYLLNPAGVIFGQNAKLDVPGSFHVSTADYLKFQDGIDFYSGDAIAPDTLSTAEPEAFGFLDNDIAGISLLGNTGSILEVQQGSTLSIIGGDITSENTSIYAPGGQINIASAASAGEISFNESGIQTKSDGFMAMGNIHISHNPLVPRLTPRPTFTIANVDASNDTAGKIFIRGGELVMDNSLITSNTNNGNGGGINISLTDDLDISAPEQTLGSSSTRSEITSISFGDGKAGNIAITAHTFDVRDNALIDNSPHSKGDGGDLSINAEFLNVLNGGKIINQVGGIATGNGGNLKIDANSINLSGKDTVISTKMFGDNGGTDLIITANALEIRDQASINSSIFSKGDGGEVTINAENLKVLDGGKIINKVEAEASSGKSGNLKINAKSIFLSGEDAIISSEVFGDSAGGDLVITAIALEVRDQASIDSSIFNKGDGGEFTINAENLKVLDGGKIINKVDAKARGKSGNLKIDAKNVFLSGKDALISSEVFGDSAGGDLVISANVLEVRDQASIDSSIFGKGGGGDLTISADNLKIFDGGKIINKVESEATGKGGNLKVDANNIVLSGKVATISTEVLGGSDGGDLTVKANNLIVQNGALIDSSNSGSGTSGKLDVSAKNIILSGDITGIINEALEHSTGELSKLSVTADNLKIQNGAGIKTRTFGAVHGGDMTIAVDKIEMNSNADISASTQGSGNAGNITIKSKNMALSGEGTDISSEARVRETRGLGSGSAGNIIISVGDMIVRDGASISTSDFDVSSNAGEGTSGNIVISLNDTLRLENKGIISTQTQKANAGNITINKGKFLWLSDSSIETSVQNDKGNGGNIFISTPVTALDNSSLIAQAQKGQGGNIKITGFLFKSPNSIVSASSELGIDGNIDLKPDTNISGSLAVLPDSFLDESQQLSERCTARLGNNSSSFVVKGRGGAPLRPGDLAPSNFLDYLPREGSLSQDKQRLDHLSHSNNRSSPYSSLGKKSQLVSMSIDCAP
jgi:filamentous hemagglutinin family protein